MLSELKNAVDLSKDISSLGFVKEAKIVLNDDAFEIARYCGLDKYGMEPGIGRMKELRQIEDIRWDKVKKVRKKIAQLLAALK